jgi:putative lipoprotein (rSAM/lipoprotein system)
MNKVFLKFNQKFLYSKRRLYYNLLKVLGVCSACFVFEACYGSPRNEVPPEYNLSLKGKVISEDSAKPIQNIKVVISNSANSANYTANTSSAGEYTYNAIVNDKNLNWTIKASDIDDTINGRFNDNETTFVVSEREFNISQRNTDLKLKRK